MMQPQKNRLFVIISYDIVNDRKRQKVSKLLENYGDRVQKSVFECVVNKKQYTHIKGKIEKIIDHKIDNVRYYTLCLRCQNDIKVTGLSLIHGERIAVLQINRLLH